MKCPESFRQFFQTSFPATSLPKNHSLLDAGDVSDQAYYVEEGCLRLWYNNDGDDVTVKFFLAPSIVSSFESFYLKLPSAFGLESIVPTTVRACSKSDFDRMMETSPEFGRQVLSIAVQCMADYQTLFLNRIMENPSDRYSALMRAEPELFDAVPHHYIASYLGITPVSLSRIRNRAL